MVCLSEVNRIKYLKILNCGHIMYCNIRLLLTITSIEKYTTVTKFGPLGDRYVAYQTK